LCHRSPLLSGNTDLDAEGIYSGEKLDRRDHELDLPLEERGYIVR